MTLRFLMKSHGMSLLEVLISIAILSFISIGIVSVTQNADEVKVSTVDEDRKMLQIEKAFMRFSFDFEQFYSPLFFDQKIVVQALDSRINSTTSQEQKLLTQSQNKLISYYNNQEDFNAITQKGLIIPKVYTENKNTLAFFTLSNRRKYQNSKESTYAWVLYTVETKTVINNDGDEESVPCLVRYFTAENPFEAPIWKKLDSLKSQILLTRVKKLNFSYWDSEKEKYTRDLRSIKNGEHIIYGIKVELTWENENEVEFEEVRFFRPSWDPIKLETDDEIQNLQKNIRQFGKKPGAQS